VYVPAIVTYASNDANRLPVMQRKLQLYLQS